MAELTTSLPFLFTYNDSVFGPGFLAEVTTHGRVLAAQDDGVWSLYGVQPGDVSGDGKTASEAQAEFRKAFTAVLYDIAEDAPNFDAFKKAVQEFVLQANGPYLQEWREAVNRVRESKLAERTECRVESADSEVTVVVEMKQARNFSPADNVLDPEPALAA